MSLSEEILGVIRKVGVNPVLYRNEADYKAKVQECTAEILAAVTKWGNAYCTDHHPYHKHRHECSSCWQTLHQEAIGTYIGECEDCGFEKQHYGDFEAIICDRCGGSIKNRGLAQSCPECNSILNAHGICHTCEACRADQGGEDEEC